MKSIRETAGADGELLSLPMKGAVIPAMAAKQDWQPFVTPLFQRSNHHGGTANANDDHQNVPDNAKDHADQCALTGSLSCTGLGVLPHQVQNQTCP